MTETAMVTTESSTSARILVGEADIDLRQTLRDALTGQGHDVVAEASNGRQVVDLAKRLQPDLVIVDANLTDVSGAEAASLILGADIAPVVLIVDPASEVRVSVQEVKVTGILVRPVRTADLPPIVDMALARHADMRSLRNRIDELEDALETRKLVERAKGMLMDLHGLSEADAFRRMRKTSMDNRKTMREVAEAILLSHDLQLGSDLT